jgi:hypothetical protein
LTLRPLWSHHTEAQLGGLALAQEAGLLLAWDLSQRLYLWDLQGTLQAQHTLFFSPIAGAVSVAGTRIVIAGAEGQLWWLDHHLRLKFDQTLAEPALALAMEPLGQYVAVSDRRRQTRLFTRLGTLACSLESPRPLHFLEFIPGQALLVGSANYGFVGCFDPSGGCKWRDPPLANVGSLATDGAGQRIHVACFSQGLRRYHHAKGYCSTLQSTEPCHWVRTNYSGEVILTASDPASGSPSLSLLNSSGAVSDALALPGAVRGLVCSSVGDVGICGLADGTVMAFRIVAP